MAVFQYSVTLRNAQLDAIATTGGGTAVLKIKNGTMPANCVAAEVGTVLATVNLPATWMSAASGGSVLKTGTWEDTSADASGTASHFRLYKNDGTTVVMQGDVTATGGGGAMTVDSLAFTAAQNFTVTSFAITAGNS